MPVFQDLSKTELLEKCLHGKTQNCNEALNAFIWNRLPKEIFIGPYVLEMGVCSAALSFNSGTSAMLRIFEELGMTSDYYTRKYCKMKNEKRINKMERKMSVEGKSDRKRKRAIKMGFQVRNDNVEGKMLIKHTKHFICIYSHTMLMLAYMSVIKFFYHIGR